jgi:hypothetical protein
LQKKYNSPPNNQFDQATMNRTLSQKSTACPRKRWHLDIYPGVVDGNLLTVSIVGDPAGLRRLAKLLVELANTDQNSNDDSVGERAHLHLHRGESLGDHSCEVELCRADAKGTGELPDYRQ